VIIHVVAMNVVQVAVVQVIRMAVVLDGHVAATRPMLVRVSLMHVAGFLVHGCTPLF
jgi:hypothetical protein